jgi:hypothetical protein
VQRREEVRADFENCSRRALKRLIGRVGGSRRADLTTPIGVMTIGAVTASFSLVHLAHPPARHSYAVAQAWSQESIEDQIDELHGIGRVERFAGRS